MFRHVTQCLLFSPNDTAVHCTAAKGDTLSSDIVDRSVYQCGVGLVFTLFVALELLIVFKSHSISKWTLTSVVI